MSYIGNNPRLKSIVSTGNTLANLTLEPRVAGRLVYATDEQKFYVDDGTALSEVGSGGFNAVDTKAVLDALPREQGKIYYATDEDKVYTDDGTTLNELGGGSGIPLLSKGGLLSSDGSNNGELTVGTDGQILYADSAETAGLRWGSLDPVNAVIAALDIDWSSADVFHKDISANETYTFSNVQDGKTIIVIINNTSGGTVTASFPTALVDSNFSGDIATGKESVFTFVSSNSKVYATSVIDMA